MATIDVGDNDLVVVYARHEYRGEVPEVPTCKIYVGNEQIGCVQELKLKADTREARAQVEITIFSDTVKGVPENLQVLHSKYVNLVKRLLPFVHIKEVGFDSVLVREHGSVS
jgi:hypothetical protein